LPPPLGGGDSYVAFFIDFSLPAVGFFSGYGTCYAAPKPDPEGRDVKLDNPLSGRLHLPDLRRSSQTEIEPVHV
jgi:hypothetical protein